MNACLKNNYNCQRLSYSLRSRCYGCHEPIYTCIPRAFASSTHIRIKNCDNDYIRCAFYFFFLRYLLMTVQLSNMIRLRNPVADCSTVHNNIFRICKSVGSFGQYSRDRDRSCIHYHRVCMIEYANYRLNTAVHCTAMFFSALFRFLAALSI